MELEDSLYPLLREVSIGMPAKEVINDIKWLVEEFTEKVQKRGGELIKKWGRSSAASTAVSIADAIKSLITPTPYGDWFSSRVYTNGNPYGIAEYIVFSMPCRSNVCPRAMRIQVAMSDERLNCRSILTRQYLNNITNRVVNILAKQTRSLSELSPVND